MIIAHNMMANMTTRMLGIVDDKQKKTVSRISSGYRINKAADDAAALAISEKMRGQIRGLRRGAENTQDGQSMINTADSAIQEQVNILQRIRDLTVQSYNDINTQDDRLLIQTEVDSLLEEIDCIARETEFNRVKVLQGPKKYMEKIVIEPSEEFSEQKKTTYSEKEFPEWATFSDDQYLTLDKSVIDNAILQDTSPVIYKVEKSDPDKAVVTFQGAQNTAQYEAEVEKFKKTLEYEKLLNEYGDDPNRVEIVDNGAWTGNLDDNYSATIDFSALANCGSVTEICEKLSDLAGSGVQFDCGTCGFDEVSGIGRTEGFAFMSDDVKISHIYAASTNGIIHRDIKLIDIQDLFNLAKETYTEEAYGSIVSDTDTLSNLSLEEQDMLAGGYPSYIAKSAKNIADRLMDKILGNTFEHHFLRITGDRSKHQIIMYDYRDKLFLGEDVKPEINKSIQMLTESKIQVKNSPLEYYEEAEMGYWVQYGANSGQGVWIDFPDTGLGSLGMEDYTVFPYGYCGITEDKRWDSSVLQGVTKIGKNRYRANIGGRYEESTTTYKVTNTKYTFKDEPYMREEYVDFTRYNDRGEAYKDKIKRLVPDVRRVIDADVPPVVTETTETRTTVSYVGSRDVEFFGYKPDYLWRVDRALDRLHSWRSDLGAKYNELEHLYLNDLNSEENLQSAESLVRDADMADEAMEYAKNNILQQAVISMLSQANTSKESVLSLLNS